jgi:putative hydrolase of the HAD superfamily
VTVSAPASFDLPAHVECVLLDAGGVLLDLDYSYLGRLIETRHGPVAEEQLSLAEALARQEVDRMVGQGGSVAGAWREYFQFLLARAGVGVEHHEPIIDSLWEAHRRVGLWTVAVEGACTAVAELKRRGYRLGVVSNAEGQVARDLDRAGFAGLFETVVDSFLVGVAKPDPAIFALALERLGLRAERTVFVGDVPSVDVAGARSAGLTAILLDRHDLYRGADVRRMRSVAELPALLGSPASSGTTPSPRT